MSVKSYYEKYWQDKLPPMRFFGGKPKPGDSEQNYKVVKRYCSSSDRIIDYGCGEGHLVDRLNVRFSPVGVDISDTAIAIAKNNYPDLVFRTIDHVGKMAVDAIVSFDVLEHIFDMDDFFGFMKRHLKIGGKLIITTNDVCCLKMFIIGLFFMDTFFDPYSPHIRFFTRKSLKKLLEMHGFKVVRVERRGNYCGILSTGQTVVAEREK